jgi:hypothetical protein
MADILMAGKAWGHGLYWNKGPCEVDLRWGPSPIPFFSKTEETK